MRKAVLLKDAEAKSWAMLGCVVRPIQPPGSAPSTLVTHDYGNALLVADALTPAEVEVFLAGLADGPVQVAGRDIAFRVAQDCEVQHVTIQNSWMEEAGRIYSFRPDGRLNGLSLYGRLLKPGAPYYPDVFEAARHWLGLREYHGLSDGRQGYITLLMPETRAAIASGTWSSEDKLLLRIEGLAVAKGESTLVGASWVGQSVYHFEQSVPKDGQVSLDVDPNADRLEIFVVSADGAPFDFHIESTSAYAPPRSFLAKRSTQGGAERVLKAVAEGEGMRVEFKEFLDLPKPNVPISDKDKFQQVLRCVAAFANTEGGTIYLGISDICEVVGANAGVSRWCESAVDEVAIGGYLGALRTKLKDNLYPRVGLQTTPIHVGERLVIAVDVARAQVPVSIQNDKRLWLRKGASNVSVPPADWPGISLDLLQQH